MHHPTEDSGNLSDDQTEDLFEFDFGITPEAHAQVSLLVGHYNSQDIDVTTSFDSLPDEDVETPKFLAQYCSNFLNDLGEDIDESQRTVSSPDSPIPIATPVPLPYCARSSEVLESMISGPKETLTHSLTLAEKLEREHAKSPDLVCKVQDEDTPAENWPVPPQAASRSIRPVSPSTLIALTEPFLMAWSTRIPLSPLPAQVPRSTATTREGARIGPAPAMHSGRNSWGY